MTERTNVKIYTGRPGRPKGVKVLGSSEARKQGAVIYNDVAKGKTPQEPEPVENDPED